MAPIDDMRTAGKTSLMARSIETEPPLKIKISKAGRLKV